MLFVQVYQSKWPGLDSPGVFFSNPLYSHMPLTTSIKRLLYPLYIYPRITPAKREALHRLFRHYKEAIHKGQPAASEKIRLFSNMEEDGIILKLLAAINTEKGYFIDIGSNDCINSNCANLAFNFDWKGLFIDADEKLLKIGKRNYRFFKKDTGNNFQQCFLTTENVNAVIASAAFTKDVDFLDIDIDGNDYAIWQAIECIQPKLVVIENKIEYGWHDIVVPAHEPFGQTQWGASLVSMTNLAEQKGYTLVATNQEGFNGFYMRNDCYRRSGLRALPVADVLQADHIRKCFYPDAVMHPLISALDKPVI